MVVPQELRKVSHCLRDRTGIVAEWAVEGLTCMSVGQREAAQRHRCWPCPGGPGHDKKAACKREESASIHAAIEANYRHIHNNPGDPQLLPSESWAPASRRPTTACQRDLWCSVYDFGQCLP